MSKLEEAKEIIQTLQDHGYEAYIIGGYVRDLLIQKPNEDIDLTTNATPEEVKQLFPKTILTGMKHGTVTVLVNKNQYEVTTFREDHKYMNNRKPEQVTYVSSLEEDVLRRDFTMNAIAFTIDGKFIDYVDGKKDIVEKRIKTVGDPFLRFHEDALRMLRAFRFSSTLGFTIDHKVLEAIRENAPYIKNISKERIIKEFEYMLKGEHFLKAIDYMIETNFHLSLKPFTKAIESMKETKIIPKNLLELMTLVSICTDFDEVVQLPIPNYIKREVRICDEMYRVNFDDFSKLILFRNGLSNCLLVNKCQVFLRHKKDLKEKIVNDYNQMPIHKQCDLKFKGDDIIKLYDKKPGAWISDILDEICINVLYGELENDYQKIRQYLLSTN